MTCSKTPLNFQSGTLAHGSFQSGTLRAAFCLFIAIALFLAAPQAASAQQQIDAEQLLTDIKVLADDAMEGREAGTPGNRKARAYIKTAFANLELEPLDGRFTHGFEVQREEGNFGGANVLGKIRGASQPEQVIVLTAHYDHLGVDDDGNVYNGADDNASGTAALLALADYFSQNPPERTMLFAALDAEEMGLQGARTFVADPPIAADRIALNINMDMVSRSEANELFAVGTYHYPFLKPVLEEVGEDHPVNLRFGYDEPDHPEQEDWTMASDHGAFHEAEIPFIYFGVEDHPGYHDPSDTFMNITPAFYINAVELIRDAVERIDQNLDEIIE